jgi:hypothetical protein
MEYKELDTLVKYCSNRINSDKFIEFMMSKYNDKNYIMDLWPKFRDNSLMFVIARNELELFEIIQKEIEKQIIKVNYV